MIREIEAGRPRYLVFVSIRPSWNVLPDSSKQIFRWFDDYRDRYYRPVGLVEMDRPRPARFYWGAEAVRPDPQGGWIRVFERAGSGS